MEDAIAREGALARCNQDRDATLNDIECANARRAAAALAVREEHDRRAQLALESQRKLLALRARAAMEQEAAARAAAAQRAAEEAAYEARWRDATRHPDAAGAALPGEAAAPVTGGQPADVPAFGSPLGVPLSEIAASHAPDALEMAPASAAATEAPVSDVPANGVDAPAAQVSSNAAPVETSTGTATLAEPPLAAAPLPSAESQPQPAPSAIPRPFQPSDDDPAASR